MRALPFFAIVAAMAVAHCPFGRAQDRGASPPVEPQESSFHAAARDDNQDGDGLGDCRRILGMLPSDHDFDRFVSPLSNPFFFEDPRSLTEAREIFFDDSRPNALGGGYEQVSVVQLRGRLSERWSVIAPRLGYLQDSQTGPRGFLSAPIGAKVNFVRDVERQFLVSAGATYFIPGSARAQASFGDGDLHFFLTAGKQLYERGHWLSATGLRVPLDGNWGTQMCYWSNQWDYEIADRWYGLFGVNWFHWLRSAGNDLTRQITSIDIQNLPAGDVAGNNVVTALAGAKWKPNGHLEVGAGFEFPLTHRTDILQNRAYADVILRY